MRGWRKRKEERGRSKFCANGGNSVFGVTDNAGSRGGKNSVPEVELDVHLVEKQLNTMARPTYGIVQAMQSLRLYSPSPYRLAAPSLRRPVRGYATETENTTGEMQSSTEVPPTELPSTEPPSAAAPPSAEASSSEVPAAVKAAPEINFDEFNARPARIVPASPSYFSGSPQFIDNVLKLESLQAKYASLPTVSAGEAPRMAWFKLPQFRDYVGEPVPMKKYKGLLKILQRLNRIQPEMVPAEVRSELAKFLRPGNPYATQNVPRTVDENGRARAKGKRKESTAVVQLVEGEGEVMVNGKSLVEMFQRVHDRESALWALRCTQRMDKYNAWITVKGGGVTGQAEAITLAIARALLLHEPGLKPVLRKGSFFPGFVFEILLTSSSSRCHYCRCSSCGEEEAGSCQGPQDAHLGQAVKTDFCVERCVSFLSIMYYFTIHIHGGLPCLFYILYSMHMGPLFNDIVHHLQGWAYNT